MIDVTDATFETDVLLASERAPVVVDLWAPWCEPCRVLGPILEKVVDETGGKVVLAKVNTDENPMISQAFQVQSIPFVVAIKDKQGVSSFLGAKPESEVRAFVQALLTLEEPTELDLLIAAGDEDSLRQALEIDPDNERAIVALGEILVSTDRAGEALELVARVPETAGTRRIAALARSGGDLTEGDIEAKLGDLLGRVRGDDEARQEFVDLLELLGPEDPRTARYRRELSARLF